MKYSIGVLDYRPSKQLSGQYDEIAKLDGYKFTLLYRRPEMGNPAWTSEFCSSCDNVVLPQLPNCLRNLFWADRNIEPVLDQYAFDALIIFGIYDSCAVWKAFEWCKRNNKPYFIRCDSNYVRDTRFFRRLPRSWIIKQRIKQASGVLYIGTQNRKYYEFFGATSDQLYCAPWEIDYPTLESTYAEAIVDRDKVRRDLGVKPGTCVFIAASRLVNVKGYDLLIPAVAEVQSKGYDVKLFIAGDGPYRSKIEKLIKRFSAPVVLLGNLDRNKLVHVMTSSDVFTLTSFSEPWGLVVNEAALCGLPMVLSNMVGAGVDLVQEGVNGCIFDVGDNQMLINSLELLAGDDQLREKMGKESRNILKSWRQRFPAIEGYRKALNKHLPV